MKQRKYTRFLAQAAVIAAVYVVLTVVFAPFSFSEVQVRISEARRLLKETDLPVREIAFQTGYDDPLNFSRMFRKVCGVSPTQFRNSTAYGDQKK